VEQLEAHQETVHEPVAQAGAAAQALVTIGAYPGRSIEQLRAPLGLSQPGAVRLVERLAASGWVTRGGSRGRRGFELRLSAAGDAVVEELLARRRAALAELLEPLSRAPSGRRWSVCSRSCSRRAQETDAIWSASAACASDACAGAAPSPPHNPEGGSDPLSRGRLRGLTPGRRPPSRAESLSLVIILGIDPGTAHTGYGVVLSHGTRLAALDGGVIETRAGVALERRLADIHARVCDLIREHEPAALAVEDLYFGRNAHSALAVGQARGVVLLSAGMAGIPCFSYTPQAVKQAVCGSGSAAKEQVQRMVGTLLSLPEPPRPDHAADALAVAICHANGAPLKAALG
jgi:crossover junction endodeoxyribonuclease RuvC